MLALWAAAHDAVAAEDRNRLDRDAGVLPDVRAAVELLEEAPQVLGCIGVLLELDAGVQVLGVLAHDHDVGLGEAGAHPGVALAGADAGVEVELLAQEHVDAAKARADRGCGGSLDADAVALDRVQGAVGERRALLGVDVLAGGLLVPVELHPGRLEHAPGRLDELGAGAVAGDEGHGVRHGAAMLASRARSVAATGRGSSWRRRQVRRSTR